MDAMPEFKEGHVTLWREGKWVQLPLEEMAAIAEADNRQPEVSEASDGA